MKNRLFLTSLASCCLFLSGFAGEAKIGVVSFRRCVEESNQGKAEQASFDKLKNQMTSVLEKTDKELEELAKKLQDSEYLDGLSPEAEQELRARYENLSQEMARYQNQYYTILNQANMKVMQGMAQQVSGAAKTVALTEGLEMIVSEDACFYFNSEFEMTEKVVAEMNRTFVSTETTTSASVDSVN